jgi:hypothetical protein
MNMAIEINNLAGNEELAKKFLDVVESEFARIKGLREQFEDSWQIADYMFKAAQNRSLNSSEGSKGFDLSNDPRANLGSPMFWRQVSQMAAEGVAVENSREVPFKYTPIINPDVEGSADRGKSEAAQFNTLAKYTMKHDKFKIKSTDFWTTTAKYGNVPFMLQWTLVTRPIEVQEPVYEVEVDENGTEHARVTGRRKVNKEVVLKAYPEARVLSLSELYADPYIGNIQDQSCVVVVGLTHKADIYNEVRNGLYDEDAYGELKDKDVWDGQENTSFKQKLLENNDKVWEATEGLDQYLKWDIWFRAPIENGAWDDEAVPEWYQATVIGNTIDDGKLMMLIRNPDPDDEVPIEMIHLYPDDADTLYHVCPADIVRSLYSAECTLMNLTLDNMALTNRPPTALLEGEFHVTPEQIKWDASGRVWQVSRPDAITQYPVRDNTQQSTALLEYVRQTAQTALGTDKNRLGENFGARTTALEANNIFHLSSQPALAWISYVIQQKIGFYAKKVKSLWRAFGTPEVIRAITDMPLLPDVMPTDVQGDFDIQIDIVDEYVDDMQAQQMLMGLVRMVAQAPQLLQSESHEIDIGELMRDVFSKAGLNADKYIKTPQGGDAYRMAEHENIAMMENGQPAQIHPDDNDRVHLRAHKAFRLKYTGLEQQYPNVILVDAHIREHEAVEMQEQQVMVPGAPAEPGGEMAGMMAGVA